MTQLGMPSRVAGHEQAKERPSLIVSANFVNGSSADICIVVPLTTTVRGVRSHVHILPPEGGLGGPSAIQCEQIRAISRRRIAWQMGTVSEKTMRSVEHALKMLLDLS